MDPAKIHKAAALLLCAVTAALCCACTGGEKPAETSATEALLTKEYTLSQTRKVIIDTDTAGDDASAIILAAKAGNIDILGVTTLAGNVDIEQSTKNALEALETAGCDAPVFYGSDENYSGEKIGVSSVFGRDGMGEKGLVDPKGEAEEKDAISFILETVASDPGEVEIIMLGPATNIAKAIDRDPDTMKKVKRIWSMGTTGYGHGNASPVAEFNVYLDPFAYKVVLDSGIDITVMGLDMCEGAASWTEEEFAQLESANEIGRFVSASFTKLREFYKGNDSGGRTKDCDAELMMCAVYDGYVTDTLQCHGSCITDGGETFGQVVFYQEGFSYDIAVNDFTYNVTLITGVNKEDYFDLFLKTIS